MKLIAVFVAILGVAVALPTATVLTSQVWSLSELSEALENPNLNPELVPYLESALNQLMSLMFAGESYNSIIVPVPAGLPLEVPVVAANPVVVAPGFDTVVEGSPSPIVVAPGFDTVVEGSPNPVIITPGLETVVGAPIPVGPGFDTPAGVAVTPVATPSASAPLVQIILNIKQNQAAPSPAAVPSPVVVPSPVLDAAVPVDAVSVVDSAVPVDAVTVVDNGPLVDPVSVIESAPAVVNPVDILHPVPTPVAVAGASPILV